MEVLAPRFVSIMNLSVGEGILAGNETEAGAVRKKG